MLGPEYDTVAGPPMFSVVAISRANSQTGMHQDSTQAGVSFVSDHHAARYQRWSNVVKLRSHARVF